MINPPDVPDNRALRFDSRAIDIIVYGATGFTGQLVVAHIRDAVERGASIRWAIGGRNPEKLKKLHRTLGLNPAVPMLVADSDDSDELTRMVSRASVVISTVGPFQIHGAKVLAACAEQGTDYLDLCGEFNFIRDQIAKNTKHAEKSGARIICSAGFDSTPFDAGVYFLQEQARALFGAPFTRVKCRVRHADIPVSGGTVASFKAFLNAVENQPDVATGLSDCFALTPGFRGPEQPPGTQPEYDERLQSWAGPFWMAMINTKNVHRTNFLLGHPYGEDFQYDEMVLTGPGENGRQAAQDLIDDTSILENALQPGEGPTQEEREQGSYSISFIGERSDGSLMEVRVDGDMDAGYGSTAKIISETAFLLIERPELSSGGIWTPIAALGAPLIHRLEAFAGLRFRLSESA